MLQLLYALMKLLLVIVVIVLVTQAVGWYVARPANAFCDSLGESDRYQQVISKARAEGYRIFEYEEGKDLVIRVPTQDSPFFRMACVVTFTNGVISHRQVQVDD